MKVTGIDPSLRAAGLANALGARALKTPAPTDATPLQLTDRLISIRRQVLDFMDEDWPDLVAYEGYSYASPQGAHQIGELGGVLKLRLREMGVPFVLISPNARAKYATGKGNASKDQVCMEVAARLGRTFRSNDEVDAYVLREMTLAAYGQAVELDVPKEHRAALTAVPWPAVFRTEGPEILTWEPVVTYKAPPTKQRKSAA